MPLQSRKKSVPVSKGSLLKQKAAKRARTEPTTSSKPVETQNQNSSNAKSVAALKYAKKPSVSFAQPHPSSSKKDTKQNEKRIVRSENTSSSPKVSKGKASSSSKAKRPSSASGPAALPTAFTIVVGSYEKLLYGVEGTYETGSASNIDNNNEASTSSTPTPTLKPVFIFPAHVASVKAVAASPDGGKWLATGSSDEIIKVWDLRRRKEVGGLMQHQGPSSICATR